MSTKFFSDGEVHRYFNPYSTPYEAFINYMNVLSDFIIRIDDAVATSDAKPEQKAVEPVPEPEAPAAEAAPKKAVRKKTTRTVKKKPNK